MSSKKKSTQTMMLFHQIARKNVRNNLKNYGIYFLTITLGIALFYTFNSTGAQFSMMNLSDEGSYLTFASGMILGVSLFICVIMGFLISYANRFLMRKRKKELGVYLSLGVSQKDISRLIRKETFFIGLLSLAVGLVCGVFLSQGLAFITMQLIGAKGASYHFVFSPLAAVGAVCFFGLLFAVMYRVNNRMLKKYKLIDLLYADKKNETFQERSGGKNLFLAACGGALVIFGYLMMLKPETVNMCMAGLGIVFIAAGTFFLFWSVSGLLLRWSKKNKARYYKGIHLFSLAQISSKLKTTNVSLSIICILLFLSISSMTVGLGMGKSMSQDLDKLTPFDATISKIKSQQDRSFNNRNLHLAQELEEKGVDLPQIGTAGQLSLYESKEANIQGKPVSLISLSDYNRSAAMQGMKPVELSGDEFVLSSTDPENRDLFESFLAQEDPQLHINGRSLAAASTQVLDRGNSVKNVNTGDAAAVVPDSAVKGLTPSLIYLNINYKGDAREANRMLTGQYLNLQDESLRLSTKSMVTTELTSTNLMLSYMAIYLGITFMICACVVLALQQMGEAEDNKKRYTTLRQLGIRSSEIRKSVLQQVSVYFGFPLLLALIHAIVVTAGFYILMPPIGIAAVLYNILFAVLVTAIIYGSYFFLTYLSGKAAAAE